MKFDFLAVLIVSVFKFVVLLLLFVRGGKVYLPMPPSWPKSIFSVCSLFSCLWFYFAHLFVLLIRSHL